ncbi:acyl-CoA thioesterase [Mycobacterium sp. pUA109]|uniref:acyl-CoA thioesterase n=1 Tax=Mycobacterium sp. pUA109 TaxID=3238982 RepID=UPI00351B9DBA
MQFDALVHTSFRVAMGDTDAAQVIYFGAPIRWSERLVTTWLADVGCATSQTLRDGYGLPAVHCELDYASALRLDDRVHASLWIDRRSQRSVTFRSEFTREGEALPAVVVRVTQVQAETGGEQLCAIPLLPKLAAALAKAERMTDGN